MFPQLDPTEATYLASLIVSILGVLLFLTLAVWMIRRKQKTITTEADAIGSSDGTKAAAPAVALEDNSERHITLEQAYQTWKAERLLQSEDGRSLFVRAGVEKSGLRYQLVANAQVQAFAILLSILMSDRDPQAREQAEALFASLLAHPAYKEGDLSSWQYLPDLPRSPRLDPDPHAEAWLFHALLTATKRLPEMKRFSYSELIQARTLALNKYIENQDPELRGQFPFCGYLVTQLKTYLPDLDWSGLGENQELFYSQMEEPGFFDAEHDVSWLGLSLLQLGILAFFEGDPNSADVIRKALPGLLQLVEDCMNDAATPTEFSPSAMLACLVPALLTFGDQKIDERVWDRLIILQPEKNDGLGATLKLLGMAWLMGIR